jgi:hypothetical protein
MLLLSNILIISVETLMDTAAFGDILAKDINTKLRYHFYIH